MDKIINSQIKAIQDVYKNAYEEGYRNGLKRGLWIFAWWKDGVQYVGTVGKTLKEALKEVDESKIK